MSAGRDARWVLGVDSGGSGLRVALARAGGPGPAGRAGVVTSAEPVRTGPSGIDAAHMAELLEPAVRELLDRAGAGGGLGAVCVGATGMASLGDDLRAGLPSFLRGTFGVRRLALAADGVTAYAGALGERPGAVVVAGTGLIAMGTDLRSWDRADGWGHLLGDCGGGAWIGRAGLEAAMRAFDGREGGSEVLRKCAEEAFGGALGGLPGQLYPRTDRPAVLASFAPEVALSAAEDPVAEGILREAAREIARSAAAVCPAPGGRLEGTVPGLALTGGLFRLGEPLTGPVREALAARLPDVPVVEPAGDPLDGAVVIAARLASDDLVLPSEPRLLHLVNAV
ncbi:BadF/BadG/BcrA/BcrD ATPase family protein [Streptomyces albiaxialis]|uniref:BadF/BadG/BcrA/BcrD ATPase family protein n=1 Tax=Streptomyces albiaxialis TaxID=329523 RepID=A0ABP5H9Z9_9ACTN